MEKEAIAPKQIWYSLYAFLGAVVLGLGLPALSALMNGAKLLSSDMELALLESAVILFLMLLMFRRKKWARTVYAILTGLETFVVFAAVLAAFMGVEPMRKALSLGAYNLAAWSLEVFLRLLSVYLLYVRPSRDWFGVPIAENDVSQSVSEESAHLLAPSSNDGIQSGPIPTHGAASQTPPSVTEETSTREPRWTRVVMRQKALLAGGLVLCMSLVVIVVYNAQRAVKADAIRSVFSADVGLSRQVSGNRSLVENGAKAIQAYTQGLRRIDMSRCPRDFQMAYLEHIQAWESLARSRASVDLLTPLFQLLVLKQIPNLPDSSDEQQASEQIARTWDRIEQIALSHGVRAPR